MLHLHGNFFNIGYIIYFVCDMFLPYWEHFIHIVFCVRHELNINPLPVQFKTLLHGQKGCVFSAGI